MKFMKAKFKDGEVMAQRISERHTTTVEAKVKPDAVAQEKFQVS